MLWWSYGQTCTHCAFIPRGLRANRRTPLRIMGILDRYFLKLKRPAPDDFASVNENLRQIERWANTHPTPAPRVIDLVGTTIPFTLAQQESFSFATQRPNTVVEVGMFIDARMAVAGGGSGIWYG